MWEREGGVDSMSILCFVIFIAMVILFCDLIFNTPQPVEVVEVVEVAETVEVVEVVEVIGTTQFIVINVIFFAIFVVIVRYATEYTLPCVLVGCNVNLTRFLDKGIGVCTSIYFFVSLYFYCVFGLYHFGLLANCLIAQFCLLGATSLPTLLLDAVRLAAYNQIQERNREQEKSLGDLKVFVGIDKLSIEKKYEKGLKKGIINGNIFHKVSRPD